MLGGTWAQHQTALFWSKNAQSGLLGSTVAPHSRPRQKDQVDHNTRTTFFFLIDGRTSCQLSASFSRLLKPPLRSNSPTFLYISRLSLARKTLDGFESASSTRYPLGTSPSTSTMAETAAPVKPQVQAQATVAESHARPTRPDEKAFNEALVKAEKDHEASMDRLVR